MTDADCDTLRAWVEHMNLGQLLALWYWICAEISHRIYGLGERA